MDKKLRVVNIGISSFYDALTVQDCEAVQIDWHPPVKISDEMKTSIGTAIAPHIGSGAYGVAFVEAE